MNEFEKFASRVSTASPETVDLVLKFMVLSTLNHGFSEAVKEATPPGEQIPPLDVLREIVDEWARTAEGSKSTYLKGNEQDEIQI